LQRLGYREGSAARPRRQSTSTAIGRILIRTREFRFWDGNEPERYFSVTLAGRRRHRSGRCRRGSPLALVRLDPALIASIYPTHNEDRVLLRREQLPDRAWSRPCWRSRTASSTSTTASTPRALPAPPTRTCMAGRTVQGASTLTQQLVKNFYLTQERTLERKLNEAYMALLLDWRYDKDEILTAYANEVYLGQDGEPGHSWLRSRQPLSISTAISTSWHSGDGDAGGHPEGAVGVQPEAQSGQGAGAA
jgi:penicillin-binding protein 1B